MKRLKILLSGGASFEVDVSDDWNLDPDIVKFQPPPGEWTERLRYLENAAVAAIIEVRKAPAK